MSIDTDNYTFIVYMHMYYKHGKLHGVGIRAMMSIGHNVATNRVMVMMTIYVQLLHKLNVAI